MIAQINVGMVVEMRWHVVASKQGTDGQRQGEVHVAFPFVEGLGRPQVCNVKSAEIGGSRLPITGMPDVGLPFCQKWKATSELENTTECFINVIKHMPMSFQFLSL